MSTTTLTREEFKAMLPTLEKGGAMLASDGEFIAWFRAPDGAMIQVTDGADGSRTYELTRTEQGSGL
jgi:hypothetical protein